MGIGAEHTPQGASARAATAAGDGDGSAEGRTGQIELFNSAMRDEETRGRELQMQLATANNAVLEEQLAALLGAQAQSQAATSAAAIATATAAGTSVRAPWGVAGRKAGGHISGDSRGDSRRGWNQKIFGKRGSQIVGCQLLQFLNGGRRIEGDSIDAELPMGARLGRGSFPNVSSGRSS